MAEDEDSGRVSYDGNDLACQIIIGSSLLVNFGLGTFSTFTYIDLQKAIKNLNNCNELIFDLQKEVVDLTDENEKLKAKLTDLQEKIEYYKKNASENSIKSSKEKLQKFLIDQVRKASDKELEVKDILIEDFNYTLASKEYTAILLNATINLLNTGGSPSSIPILSDEKVKLLNGKFDEEVEQHQIAWIKYNILSKVKGKKVIVKKVHSIPLESDMDYAEVLYNMKECEMMDQNESSKMNAWLEKHLNIKRSSIKIIYDVACRNKNSYDSEGHASSINLYKIDIINDNF